MCFNMFFVCLCIDSKRRSLLKKLPKPIPTLQNSRSFSFGFQHSASPSDSLSDSPTQSLSPGPTTPCRSPAPDYSAGKGPDATGAYATKLVQDATMLHGSVDFH